MTFLANSIAAAFEYLTEKVLRLSDVIPGIAWPSKRLALANHLRGRSSKASIGNSCIPRPLTLTRLAAARTPAASEEAAWVGGPKPSTRRDRRGLKTGGRDLPRRTSAS